MDEEHSRIPQAHLVCTPNQGVRLGKAHRRAPGTPYDTDQGYSERYNRWGKHRQPWKLATAENQEANQNQWTIRYPRTLISLPPLWGKNGNGPSMPSSHRTPRNGQGSVTSSLRPHLPTAKDNVVIHGILTLTVVRFFRRHTCWKPILSLNNST